MGERRRPGMMRVMVRAGREVHMRRAVEMRHVSGGGGSLMVIARSAARRKPGRHGRRRVRIMVPGDEAVDHGGIGMIQPPTMIMRGGGGGKHGGGIVGGVTRMRRPHDARRTVREFDGGERLGPHALVRRKELGKRVEVMREIGGGVMRRVMLMRVDRRVMVVVMMRIGRQLLMRVSRRARGRRTAAGRVMVRVNGRHAGMKAGVHARKALSQGAIGMMGGTRCGAGGEKGLRVEWTRKWIGETGGFATTAPGRGRLSEVGVMGGAGRDRGTVGYGGGRVR